MTKYQYSILSAVILLLNTLTQETTIDARYTLILAGIAEVLRAMKDENRT